MVRKLPVTLFLLLLAASVSAAAEIKVATLNCFLLSDPPHKSFYLIQPHTTDPLFAEYDGHNSFDPTDEWFD